ncbi:MAG TPA: sialidase family protein [Gammaproteobacteria bacterium]|nr:sialidase family protein [Gammaproteobacteria bacterium]
MRQQPALSILFALVLISVAAGTTRAQETGFPYGHRHFLSAGTFGVGFGFLPLAAEPGPGSSDTGVGRPPRIGPNIQVNEPQGFPVGRSETAIAAGGNGQLLVVGWNDAAGFCGPPAGFCGFPPGPAGFTGYGFSSDGGGHFTDGGAPPLGDRIGFGPGPGDISPSGIYTTLSDPALAIGGTGNDRFYYANIAVFEDQGPGIFFGLADPSAGVSVHMGRFSPAGTFLWQDSVLLQSPNYPNDFLDKEFIAADRRGDSDRLYVSVTNLKEVEGVPMFGFGQIETYSSTDSGQTWNRAIVQPDETLSVADNSGVLNQGSEPAVGPDGTVYVAWERGWLFPVTGSPVTPEIRVAKSTDAGVTWTPAAAGPPSSGINPAGILVSKICAASLFPPSGYNRFNNSDFPRIAVARSGPRAGRVHVVWADCRTANGGTQEQTGGFGHPDSDIYLAYSDDQGATWSAPVLVAGGGDGKIQFWPTVSIQPGGNVDITYFESEEIDVDPADDAECSVPITGGPDPRPQRTSPVSSFVDVYWAQSTDGGASFDSPVKVTEVTTNWCETVTNIRPNFGDYNGAASAGNRLYVTWADGRSGVPDVFFSEILSAGKAPQ